LVHRVQSGLFYHKNSCSLLVSAVATLDWSIISITNTVRHYTRQLVLHLWQE